MNDEQSQNGWHDTPPSSEEIELNEAFKSLYTGLREAKTLFGTGDDAGREGAIHALETVVKFLGRFQPVVDEGLHAPLAVLLDGLLSLSDGAVAPLLKHIPHTGQSRASALRECTIGAAAFVVDRLCAAGYPDREAQEFVASTLRAEGVRAARGRFPEVTADTVRTWCDDVAADMKAQAAQVFKGLTDDPENLPPPGADARQFFHRHLVHVARAIRAAENS
jgi:hypothetical protein